MRKVPVLIALIPIALAAAQALAAEGRTPVFLPGSTLAADGKYILTRNLTGPPPVIRICGANVDLDLNGMVVTNTAAVGETITTAGCPVLVDHVTIRNGRIDGGAPGIFIPGPTRKVDIEDVKISDTGGAGAIHMVSVEGAAIRRVEITDAAGNGILWNGGGASTKHGSIEHNLLRRAANGIFIFGCSSVAILNNRIEEGTGSGISLFNCNASLLSENTIERKGAEGILIRNGRGNKLFDNVITESGLSGIRLDATTVDTLVLNNVSSVNGAVGAPAAGILVEGNRNVIERNVLNDNAGGGLVFSPVGGGGCDNTFGRNTARGNLGAGLPPCGAAPPGQLPPQYCNGCAGPVNSSYGDNLMPGPPIG